MKHREKEKEVGRGKNRDSGAGVGGKLVLLLLLLPKRGRIMYDIDICFVTQQKFKDGCCRGKLITFQDIPFGIPR